MPDLQSDTAALIRSLETGIGQAMKADDTHDVRLARELQQVLEEVRSLLR
jgi:DNA replication initiation complex subunit (GINS family)